MHVDIVPTRSSRPTILLWEPRREGKGVRKRMVANSTNSIREEAARGYKSITLNRESLRSNRNVPTWDREARSGSGGHRQRGQEAGRRGLPANSFNPNSSRQLVASNIDTCTAFLRFSAPERSTKRYPRLLYPASRLSAILASIGSCSST
jgi:hypothetical protein